MLKKICLIVNFNLYESKRYFARKFAEAFERKGIKTLILDWEQYEDKTLPLKELLAFSPDLTLSFNSILPLSNGQFLWDRLHTPHLAYLVDPALYSVDLVKSPYSIVSCVDRGDCQALRSIPFNNVLFLPHAIERELASDKTIEKIYDVAFLGSCNDYETIRKQWQQKYPQKIGDILDTAAELVLSDRYISLAEALTASMNQHAFSEVNIDFLDLFSLLDTYTRGKDRVELIKAIKNPKIKVHIFGRSEIDRCDSDLDWQHYVGKQQNVVLHPPVAFAEAMEIMKQSKICLNSMPFFKDGTHERVFAALACGALPVTSSTKYLEEHFKNGEELISYQPGHWDKVNDVITDLIENPKKREEIVRKGRENVMTNHTWDSRVDYLQNVLPAMMIDIIT